MHVAVVAAGILAAAAAEAASVEVKVDAEGDTARASKTAVSGHSGTEVKVGDGKHFLYGLWWSERSDDPCWMRVFGARLVDGKWDKYTRDYALEGCAEKAASSKGVGFQSPDTFDRNGISEARFIRSIRICTSEKKDSSKEKLKGIEIHAVRLTTEGRLVEDGAEESAQRTNCATWEKTVSCKAGEAATALYVNSSDRAEDSFNGIALECAPVKREADPRADAAAVKRPR
jgi:hypothetical protein